MPSTLPSPVAAALGIVPTVLDGVRRIPGKAVQLPVLAISSALTSLESVRREYAALAQRGELVVGRLRGEAGELADDIADRADELEDRVESLVERTPLATAYDRVEDTLEDAGDSLRSAASTVTDRASSVVDEAVDGTVAQARSLAEDLQDELEQTPEAEQPKGQATPKAPSGEVHRVDSAAAADVVSAAEQATTAVHAQVLDHDDLPLADYDHMTLGSLRGRLRSLSVEELAQVRTYEKAHADRLPVVTMLDNRLARLSTDEAAVPSASEPTKPAPAKKAAKRASKASAKAGSKGNSKVTPATSSAPSGPSVDSGPSRPLN